MRWFTLESLRIFPVSLFTKTAIGTPQARWREITQSGLSAIMPRRRFCPAAGKNLVSSIAFSALSRRPWLDMEMNHCGVLRKMIGFLERQEWG